MTSTTAASSPSRVAFTNTGPDAANDMADRVNDAFANGWAVTVYGRPVKSWSTTPAKVWGTGTLSVSVVTRSGVGVTETWVMTDATAVFTFTREVTP